MTREELKLNSVSKEVEKYQIRLEKLNTRLQKKEALCNKLNCNWTDEEFKSRRLALIARHPGEAIIPFGKDDDLITEKQSSAYWDLTYIQSEIKDVEHRLAVTLKSLEKATLAFEGILVQEKEQAEALEKEKSWIQFITAEQQARNAEEAERKYQEWLKAFKAECLKDGVIIDEASSNWVKGKTKSGKPFYMDINWGFTSRSNHCYTLKIDGRTIFTSGLFSTAYSIIKH